MFTVKLYRSEYNESNQSLGQFFSCFSVPAYDVFERGSGMVTITLYNNMFKNRAEGVDYHLSHKEENRPESTVFYYHHAYIENAAGKTIQKILPQDGEIKVASKL